MNLNPRKNYLLSTHAIKDLINCDIFIASLLLKVLLDHTFYTSDTIEL